MPDLIADFLKQKRFTVAGSFRNESKYAYRILKILKDKGYEVFPVNPRLGEVEGVKCYLSVKDIPGGVDVVNLVTPPEVSERIVKECKEIGINKIWLQPGAENNAVIKYCNDNKMELVYNVCVMLEAA